MYLQHVLTTRCRTLKDRKSRAQALITQAYASREPGEQALTTKRRRPPGVLNVYAPKVKLIFLRMILSTNPRRMNRKKAAPLGVVGTCGPRQFRSSTSCFMRPRTHIAQFVSGRLGRESQTGGEEM